MTRNLGLTKHAPPLLRTVDNKPYASDDNHFDQPSRIKRTPQRAKAENVTRSTAATASGQSSQLHKFKIHEDEAVVLASPKSDDSNDLPSCQNFEDPVSSFEQLSKTALDGANKENLATFKVPHVSGSSQDKKRSSPSTPDGNVGSKRRKIASPQFNIHAQKKQVALYGTSAEMKRKLQNKDREKKRKRQMKEAKHTEALIDQEKSTGFRKLDDITLDEYLSPSSSFVVAGAAADCEGLDDHSEALSDVEPISAVKKGQRYLPPPKPYVSTKECQFCHEEVETLLHEDFMDQYNHGRELNYKWEKRFCNFHRKHKAERQWKERGYPKIDWSCLGRRMEKHDTLLRNVLDGSRQSYYRDKAAEQLKGGRNKLANMITDNSVKPGASVGYYGPRGQKAMMEHIMTSLGDDIRKRAVKDKLVRSAGASGGVAGFVQNVLVPHLAELLIKEDGRLTVDWIADVRETIAESGELGEIMHPELEDDIRQVDSDDEG